MTSTPRRPAIRLPWATHEPDEESTPQDEAPRADDQPAGPEAATPATASGGPDEAWPRVETDAYGASTPTEAATPTGAATDMTASPLMTSLVTAMREVAEREREASLSQLRDAVDRQVAAIQARLSEEADELRRRSELDVAGIADWVREETERIRIEAERKVQARQQQLVQQLTDHEKQGEREVDSLRTRLSEYEKELAAFFTQLEAINDPAAFGAAAKRMPQPPAIGQAPTPAVLASPAPVDASKPAASVEPEAVTSEPEPVAEPATEPAAQAAAEVAPAAEVEPATEPVAETAAEVAEEVAVEPAAEVAEEVAVEPAAEPVAESQPQPELDGDGAAPAEKTPAPGDEPVADSEHTLRLAALGIEHPDDEEPEGSAATVTAGEAVVAAAKAAADASASAAGLPTAATTDESKDAERLEARLAELDATLGSEPGEASPTTTVPAGPSEAATAVIVKGLGSFGAITSFKQALERVEGVRGISLSLGPTGEFVYRATHDPAFDLAVAIETIEHGSAQVERLPDGSLRVTVSRGR
jgi:hypothetical protein